MFVDIDDFRGFHSARNVPVRPITILVGENSSGKSSFLALLRLFHEYFSTTPTASFNKAPFFLGAYEQVAHFKSIKSGAANRISLSIKEYVEPISITSEDRDAAPPGEVSIKFTYNNKFSQPSISSILFITNIGSVEFKIGDSINVLLKLVNGFELKDSPSIFDSAAGVLGFFSFYMSNIIFFMTDGSVDRKGDVGKAIQNISQYFSALSRKIGSPVFASSPVRTKPDRAYTPIDEPANPEGGHVPYLLARLKRHQPLQWEILRKKLSNFGKESGLFRNIDVKQLGKSESDPFQIYVDHGGSKRNIIDVGYGVSQVLPILAQMLSVEDSTLFLFQQPEVHLHPQAQAALGSLFVSQYISSFHRFVLETHSDFIIDRIRMAVRDGIIKTDDVSILYFRRDKSENKIINMDIDQNGNIIGSADDYRKFFLEETMRSIG